MKKITITFILSIILAIVFGATANAVNINPDDRYLDGRYAELGSPIVGGPIEITVLAGDHNWKPGDPLENVKITLQPCGGNVKAYYDDEQTAVFLVGYNHEIMCYTGNGKALVNDMEYEANAIDNDLYEIRIPSSNAHHDNEQFAIGTPAVCGPLTIDVSLGDHNWKPGDSLENVDCTVDPCGKVVLAYYNDMQTAVFIVEVNPKQVYFVSNGFASVNGTACTIEQVGENRYSVELHNNPSKKYLEINVNGMDFDIGFEITAFDDNGTIVQKIAVIANNEKPVILEFPEEVSEIRIHEILPADFSGYHSDIQIKLARSTKVTIDSGNRSVECSDYDSTQVLAQIMQLLEKMFGMIRNMTNVLAKF